MCPNETRLACIFAIGLVFVLPQHARAQTAEDRAHIDYEAAKIALEQGQGSLALAKLENVIEVLGPLPDLLVYAAKAAALAGDREAARRHLDAAFASADPPFRQSPLYKELIRIAAELEVADSALDQAMQQLGVPDWSGRLGALRRSLGVCYSDSLPLIPGLEIETQFSRGAPMAQRIRTASVVRGQLVVETDAQLPDGTWRTSREVYECGERELRSSSGSVVPKLLSQGTSWSYELTVTANCSITNRKHVEGKGHVSVGSQTLPGWRVSFVSDIADQCAGLSLERMTGEAILVPGLGEVAGSGTFANGSAVDFTLKSVRVR